MKVNLESLTQAFEDWETEYRANPENFLTQEEVAQLETADVSKARAIHLLALLRQRQTQGHP